MKESGANRGPVLVTGAARGLGAAIAEALAARGVEPILLGRSLESLGASAGGAAARLGRPVRKVAADVTDFAALERGLAAAMGRGESLGGIVNNAGVIDPIDRVEDSDPAAWARCVQINLTGAYNVLRAGLPRIVAGGVVANVSSGAAEAEHAGWSAYAASKAGLERLSATLAGERPDLMVVAVRPGVTDTGMQGLIRRSRVDNAIRGLPREALQPAEIPAKAIADLFTRAVRSPGRIVEAKEIPGLTA
jgi:3-oxoacyl-[acyl-carrier protein] reductase